MIRMKPPLPAQGRPDEEKDRSAIRGPVLFPLMQDRMSGASPQASASFFSSRSSVSGFDGGDARVTALGEVELPDAHAHVKDV